VDTGATDTNLRHEDAQDNRNVTLTNGQSHITVEYPNGTTAQSIAEGTLKTGSLELSAHVFPNEHMRTSLIAVADYTNDHDCEVLFTKHSVVVTDPQGHIVVQAPKKPEERLWKLDLNDYQAHTSSNIIRHELNAQKVDFWRKTLGSPTQSTLVKALRKDYLKCIPQITTKMVTANPSTTMATASLGLALGKKLEIKIPSLFRTFARPFCSK